MDLRSENQAQKMENNSNSSDSENDEPPPSDSYKISKPITRRVLGYKQRHYTFEKFMGCGERTRGKNCLNCDRYKGEYSRKPSKFEGNPFYVLRINCGLDDSIRLHNLSCVDWKRKR